MFDKKICIFDMCNNYDYDWKMLKMRIKHAKD